MPDSAAPTIEPLLALEAQTSQLSASAAAFQPPPMSAPPVGVSIMEEMRRKALERISPSIVPIAMVSLMIDFLVRSCYNLHFLIDLVR